MLNTINIHEASEFLNNPNTIILDVRSASEYVREHIPTSKHIDLYDLRFNDKVKTLNRESPYVVVCLSGGRSGEAVTLMQSFGFSNARNLLGGITAWKVAGLPVTSGEKAQ